MVLNIFLGSTLNHAFNVCFLAYSIFKYDQFNKDTGSNLTIDRTTPLTAWYAKSSIKALTIDQVMKYTPSVNETLSDCMLRKTSEDSLIDKFNSTECSNFITLSKFVANDLLCYRFLYFIPLEGVEDVLISFDPFEMYEVYFLTFSDSHFNNTNDFWALFNSRDRFPVRELVIATHSDRAYDYKKTIIWLQFLWRSILSVNSKKIGATIRNSVHEL